MRNQYVARNWRISDLESPALAGIFSIDNQAPDTLIDNLKRLGEEVINPLESLLGGERLFIDVGYVGPALADKLELSFSDPFRSGEAIGVRAKHMSNVSLARLVAKEMSFDQVELRGLDKGESRSGFVKIIYKPPFRHRYSGEFR